MARSRLQLFVLLVLIAAGTYTLAVFYGFSQGRFFTVDEYQYGHATWLVAQGQVPFVDFFEHHFPLSYVLHAPLFTAERDFVASALLLRRIVFVYWVLVGLIAAATCFAVTRDRLAAILAAFMPPSFGFGLMSAVDYRADNLAAVYFAACLLLLEWNRDRNSRALAIVCGLLAATAVAMTQKLIFFAGGTFAVMLVVDRVARSRGSDRRPFIRLPLPFLASGALLAAALIGVAAALGMLPPGIETTVIQAVEHEQAYDRFSIWEMGYPTRFWNLTWPTTSAILVFSAGFLLTRRGRFWLIPMAFSVVGLWLYSSPYPYNFVFLCWTIGLSAVRGFALFVKALETRLPALRSASPLLYLLPLLVLSSQFSFVVGTSTNAHQLRVLAKIEKYGEPTDAVIDSAGGGMFSPHASYYFYHGNAHRQMFRDYFTTELVDDYRRSQALFWIWDMRSRKRPLAPRNYLESHYVHGGDGLYALGVRTPVTRGKARSFVFDAVRAGTYRVFPSGRGPGRRAPARDHDLLLDGVPLTGDRVHLEAGKHPIDVLPGSPEYIVTAVDPSFFDANPARPRYSMMFEYR
ncbi:MAG: hypothetical protein VX466_05515 [Myxococcota bacterium]|nr:hypothetical protein [Myxococcota bacterium]